MRIVQMPEKEAFKLKNQTCQRDSQNVRGEQILKRRNDSDQLSNTKRLERPQKNHSQHLNKSTKKLQEVGLPKSTIKEMLWMRFNNMVQMTGYTQEQD